MREQAAGERAQEVLRVIGAVKRQAGPGIVEPGAVEHAQVDADRLDALLPGVHASDEIRDLGRVRLIP